MSFIHPSSSMVWRADATRISRTDKPLWDRRLLSSPSSPSWQVLHIPWSSHWPIEKLSLSITMWQLSPLTITVQQMVNSLTNIDFIIIWKTVSLRTISSSTVKFLNMMIIIDHRSIIQHLQHQWFPYFFIVNQLYHYNTCLLLSRMIELSLTQIFSKVIGFSSAMPIVHTDTSYY